MIDLHSHEQRWNLVLLRQEKQELLREHSHLETKSRERDLTNWEISRMESLLDELMILMTQFSKIDKFDGNSNSR